MLRRLALAVVLVCALVAVVATAVRPSDPTVPSAGFRAQFVAACGRSGVDQDRCRCAYDRWVTATPADQLAGLDERLRDGDELPLAARQAVAGCLAGAAGGA